MTTLTCFITCHRKLPHSPKYLYSKYIYLPSFLLNSEHSLDDYCSNFTTSQEGTFRWITGKLEQGKQTLAFITGGAGVGKTYVMKALVAYCLAADKHVAKMAPTGAAACLINGQTIHSFFRLDGHLNCHMNRRDKWYEVVQNTDVFFIDEVSMISEDLFDTIDNKLRECTGKQQLFGGKSVILFGDPAQLPPMNKRPIWQDRFLAKFDVMVLKESKRQSDPAFIALLNRARLGVLTYNDCEELRKRIVPDTDIMDPRMSDATILVPFRDLRDAFNRQFLETVPGNPKTYHARDVDSNDRVITGSTATFIRDNEKQWNLHPRTLQLKVGCRAMLLRNISVQDHWVNGQL